MLFCSNAKIRDLIQLQAILRKNTLNCAGTLLSLDKPMVMGILNITPDSFYANSRVTSHDQWVDKAGEMIESGADILDLGAQSTRPGAQIVTAEEELERLMLALDLIKRHFPAQILSIDTFYASVAEHAAKAGASMINDVSGGEDAAMFETVAATKLPYVLMHRPGNAQVMQKMTNYQNLLLDMAAYFKERLARLSELGVHDIVLDPGFGFGKTLEQNYELLANLNKFQVFELPILAGVSRKKMIQQITNNDVAGALNGTTAVHMFALQQGAKLLRVHDVKEAVECIKIYMAIEAQIA